MRITITGPRSSGKTTISKLLSKQLKLKYISSDEIGEKAFEKYGGLDKAIKLGVVEKFIKKDAYGLIRNVYQRKNFVFDLSGGAFTSKKLAVASRKIRNIAKKESIIFGLLPSKNLKESISFLFKREKKRTHFKRMDSVELLKKVRRNFKEYPSTLEDFCNHIIYIKEKSPKKVVDEILKRLK